MKTKQNFNTRNKTHKKFYSFNANQNKVLMISCLKNKGEYLANLSHNICLCCGEILK